MTIPRLWRRRLAIAGGALIAFLLIFTITEQTPATQRSDNTIQDFLLVNWPPAPTTGPSDVVLVTITESTLASLPYRSPIDRGMLARIIDVAAEAGVKAMAFDILIDQATEPEKDAQLAQAMQRFPGTIIVAWADHRGGMLEQQSAWLEAFIQASGATPGFANLTTDRDGVGRRFQHTLPDTDHLSLAAALYKAGTNHAPPVEEGRIVWRQGIDGAAQAFTTLPATGLLALGKVRPQALKALLGGKLILVGADLPLVDRHTSSLSASLNPDIPHLTAGVEIHAHILHQMLEGPQLQTLGAAQTFVILLIMALLAVLLALSNIHFLLKCLALLIITSVYCGMIYLALYEYLYLIPMTQPLVVTLVMFGATLGISTLFLSSDKSFIREAFGQYISPKLVAQMIDNPDLLSVGGVRKDLSFIFSDIAGFTSLSESITPERLTTLLNDYLGHMSDIVVRHNGIVDKFIGDAVVAIFGAPGDDPDHRRNALECALEMDAFCQDFIRQNTDINMGVTRIGVHSGEAIVGNFGGERRYDYTAMGDTMNIAARLESANKFFGTCLAASGSTMAFKGDLKQHTIDHDGQTLVRLGNFIFKGKNTPVEVWTPLNSDDQTWIERCEMMIGLIDRRDDKAAEFIEQMFEASPAEPVVAFHKGRLDRGETGLTTRLVDK